MIDSAVIVVMSFGELRIYSENLVLFNDCFPRRFVVLQTFVLAPAWSRFSVLESLNLNKPIVLGLALSDTRPKLALGAWLARALQSKPCRRMKSLLQPRERWMQKLKTKKQSVHAIFVPAERPQARTSEKPAQHGGSTEPCDWDETCLGRLRPKKAQLEIQKLHFLFSFRLTRTRSCYGAEPMHYRSLQDSKMVVVKTCN